MAKTKRFWIYKCNSKNAPHQVVHGDWERFYSEDEPSEWGSTEWVSALKKAKRGDLILAYQTDRNELVGTASVVRWEPSGAYRNIILKPLDRIGVKVRPLKKRDPKVARIPALRQGRVATLYSISSTDANRLLKAARAELIPDADKARTSAEWSLAGAGFGNAIDNRRVEKAAVSFVKRYFKRQCWTVTDISKENRGYDLLCKRGSRVRHVEVKGCKGSKIQFIITANEKRAWSSDRHFILALVTGACSPSPFLRVFSGRRDLKKFRLATISYVASIK